MPLPSTGLTLNVDASVTTRLWKEIAMTNHPADGDGVAMWDDVSDATIYCIGDVGPAPLYAAAAFNGLGCLDFNGTTQYLQFVDDAWISYQNSSLLIAVDNFTIFASFIMEGNATNEATFYNNTALIGETGGYFGLHFTTVGAVHKVHAYNYDGTIDEVGVTISQNTKYVAMIKHTGGRIYIDVNNGALTGDVASGNTSSRGPLYVGRSTGAKYFDGKCGEVAFYNTNVTGTDLSDAWTYFMDKWVTSGAAFMAQRPLIMSQAVKRASYY